MSRWTAIESTYERALAAERALPGVPLKDVFQVTVRSDVEEEKGAALRTVFCRREDFPKVQDKLNAEFAGLPVTIGTVPSCRPYSPKKGEPKYNEWKEGK